MQSTFIVALIFAVMVAIFALLNGDEVTINLLFKRFEMSQALVILISAVFGAIAVYFMNLVHKVKGSLKTKELNKKIKQNEIEISDLKAKIEKYEMASETHSPGTTGAASPADTASSAKKGETDNKTDPVATPELKPEDDPYKEQDDL
jgi:uncharacterized integral membrane protein